MNLDLKKRFGPLGHEIAEGENKCYINIIFPTSDIQIRVKIEHLLVEAMTKLNHVDGEVFNRSIFCMRIDDSLIVELDIDGVPSSFTKVIEQILKENKIEDSQVILVPLSWNIPKFQSAVGALLEEMGMDFFRVKILPILSDKIRDLTEENEPQYLVLNPDFKKSLSSLAYQVFDDLLSDMENKIGGSSQNPTLTISRDQFVRLQTLGDLKNTFTDEACPILSQSGVEFIKENLEAWECPSNRFNISELALECKNFDQFLIEIPKKEIFRAFGWS